MPFASASASISTSASGSASPTRASSHLATHRARPEVPRRARAWLAAAAAPLALAALTVLLFYFGSALAAEWAAASIPQRDVRGTFSTRQTANYR